MKPMTNTLPLVLTADIGTQSMRVSLIDSSGKFVDMEKEHYQVPYLSKYPGWAEQKPSFYYDVFCRLARKLMERNEERKADILCFTLCCFRDSAVLLDEKYEPVRNIILWLDQRKGSYHGEFGKGWSFLFKAVGMYDTAVLQYEATPANWIREKEPDVWKKTRWYMMLPGYLNYLLTGNLKDSICNETGHMPVDYKKRKWLGPDGINERVLQVPLEMMIETVDSGEVLGYINAKTAERSGIPEGLKVIGAAPDKACETLGLTVNEPGSAAVSLGTAATIDLAVDHYVTSYPFLPSYPACDKKRWNPELQIYRGFWMIQWFLKNFCQDEIKEAEDLHISAEDRMNQKMKEVPAGCDGLMVQPYWQPGIEHPHARGAILGITDKADRSYYYRAIIEGIGMTLRSGMENLEKRAKMKISRLYIAGGGSRSSEICQMMADIFGLPFSRMTVPEACSLGAAEHAFASIGVYPSWTDSSHAMSHIRDTFCPDEKTHQIYEELYQKCYRKMYQSTEKIHESLFRLLNP